MKLEKIIATEGVILDMSAEIKQVAEETEQKKSQNKPVINDIMLKNPIPDDRPLIEATRRLWGLTDRDNVRIFVVEPDQYRRMRHTNFVTRPTTSATLERLTRGVRSNRSKINDLRMGISDPTLTDAERGKKIAQLEEEVKQYRRGVARERTRLSKAPRSGVIVVARGAN